MSRERRCESAFHPVGLPDADLFHCSDCERWVDAHCEGWFAMDGDTIRCDPCEYKATGRRAPDHGLPPPRGSVGYAARLAAVPHDVTPRGLTLIRPWAWAVASAGKDVENRTWVAPRVAVGGWLAIHAGQKWDAEAVAFIRARVDTTRRDVPTKEADTSGAIVAVAQLAEVLTASESPWFSGPYGWRLDNVVQLPAPVPCKGAQGLWSLPSDVLANVRAGVERLRAESRP